MSIAVAFMCRKGHKLDVLNPVWNLDSGELVLDEGSLLSTGAWVVSEERADELVGKDLILCETRNGEAYVGGRIVGYVFTRDEKNNPRTTFNFTYNKSLNGTTVDNWVEQNPVHYIGGSNA